MKKLVFEGCAPAVITPFRANLSVNFEELKRIVDFQIENGVDAIVVCGTTGEASSMTDEEHIEVMRETVSHVAGRVPVIAGTGSNSTEHAVMMSREARECGADAVLLVTPYYNKTSQRGLVRHFSAIAEAVDIPMILYNVPARTGMTIAPQTYKELSKLENIVATKESSGDFTAITTAMSLCGEDLVFYSGNDENAVPMTSLGGKGLISVAANVEPSRVSDMCRYALRGDYKRAARLQLELTPLINALFSDVNPIPVKDAMNLIGFDAGLCRLPLCELDSGKREALMRLLAN